MDDNGNNKDDENGVFAINRSWLEDLFVRVGIMTTMGDIMIAMGVAFLAANDEDNDGEGGITTPTAMM